MSVGDLRRRLGARFYPGIGLARRRATRTCYGRPVTTSELPAEVAAALRDHPPGDRITVDAAGIPWSALVWGDPDDRPLIVIHGVTACAEAWWRTGPALAATGRRVVAVDQAGHGQTGHWIGHHRFVDNAADLVAFIRAAGLDRAELQVIGHSWGAVTAAALPIAGLRPATLVLLDPPVLPLAYIALEASDPKQQPTDDLAQAIAMILAQDMTLSDGDVHAMARGVVEMDVAAVRSIVLDNGDWDGGLADLKDPSASGLDVWVIRGDPRTGSYVSDDAARAFAAVVGEDHVLSIPGAPHSPIRTHPVQTLEAFLHALGPA
jgi:pimeloyl-ACP methyl ester carboxylesterase